MALLMTLLTVVAALGGISLLLWLSTFVEARHLGPALSAEVDVTDGATRPAVADAGLSVVPAAVQTAA